MTDEELRMEAYYYSFDTTGQVEIDRILSAVACAGKAFHYTGDWNDDATPRTFHEGATPIDWIQNRAKEAADTIEALRAENARLREALRPFADVAENDICESLTDADIFRPMTREYSRASMLTVGDLRAARAAMGERE